MSDQTSISLLVNGKSYEVATAPRTLLADVIRADVGLTGTHLGCEHGVCGACTVLLDGEPVRSCLIFALQADGHSIETVESLELDDGSLNPLQAAFQKHHGLQCGFCTSGILMSLTSLFREQPAPSEESIRSYIQGHICRCTGYQQMIDATLEVSADHREEQ